MLDSALRIAVFFLEQIKNAEMKTMMGITDKLLHSTVRIDCLNATGTPSSGTGFFYNLTTEGSSTVPVIVTNKHVVTGAARGFFQLTLTDDSGEPVYGQHERIELLDFATGWIEHPDPKVDLAVCMFGPVLNQLHAMGKRPCYAPINENLIPDASQLADLKSVEDILMIGYPNGLWDSKNNLPLVRRGITATPAFRDYNGKQEFVIDAACFPGSSGSPVFIVNQGIIHQKNGEVAIGGSRLLFLGVLYAAPQISATGRIVVQSVPTNVQSIPVVNTMMNLGFCIRSSRVAEFKNSLRDNGMLPQAPKLLSANAA
jgi:Trypsin-like peptidase domain